MKKYLKFIFLLFVAFLAIPILSQDVPVDPPAVEPGFNWWTIISGVLAVAATLFGAAFKKIKGKLKLIIAFGKESLDVLFIGSEALDDNVVDAEEVAALKKAIAEAKVAWKAIWNK